MGHLIDFPASNADQEIIGKQTSLLGQAILHNLGGETSLDLIRLSNMLQKANFVFLRGKNNGPPEIFGEVDPDPSHQRGGIPRAPSCSPYQANQLIIGHKALRVFA